MAATYSIAFTRPGEPGVHEHKLRAGSDAEARIRFLNLSWVAFTEIAITSVAIASDQPDEDKAAARKASGRKGRARKAAPGTVEQLPTREARRATEAATRAHVLRAGSGGDKIMRGLEEARDGDIAAVHVRKGPPRTLEGIADEIANLTGMRSAHEARGDYRSAAAVNQHINKLKRERHALAEANKERRQ